MSRRLDLRRSRRDQVSGEEFLDPVDRMTGDAAQQPGHVSSRVDAVQLCRSEQAGDRRRTFVSMAGADPETGAEPPEKSDIIFSMVFSIIGRGAAGYRKGRAAEYELDIRTTEKKS